MKIHLERRWPQGMLFGIMPALCGRKKPTDYRMYSKDDALGRRAHRKFFTEQRGLRGVTCATCRKLYKVRHA